MKVIQLKLKPFTSFTQTKAYQTILRRRLTRFIYENSAVFEGPSRQSMPFGGNVRANCR